MPTWRELKRFCEKDGWELYRSTDHYYYRKQLSSGVLKRTKFPGAAKKYSDFFEKYSRKAATG